jgi:hypothetical protein
MRQDLFGDFVKGLRAEQDRLRGEIASYHPGPMRLFRRAGIGQPLEDITAQRIAEINGEIVSLEKTIRFVIAQREGRDA